MFNEDHIRQNTVTYHEGRADVIRDILMDMMMNGKASIKNTELEEQLQKEQQEYEKLWNKWADQSKIGGSRYDETGNRNARKEDK